MSESKIVCAACGEEAKLDVFRELSMSGGEMQTRLRLAPPHTWIIHATKKKSRFKRAFCSTECEGSFLRHKTQLDKICKYLRLEGVHPLCVHSRFNNVLHVESLIFDCSSCEHYVHKEA